VEIKFCPTCGKARAGNYCGGCGLNFSSFAAGIEQEETLQILVQEASPASHSLPAGLIYGESFDPEGDCPNCGTPTGGESCGFCSDEE
jgi:hypothetical protein